MKVRVLYFASLRDTAGHAEAEVETMATTPAALYDELQARHGFGFARGRLRVAVDDAFVDWCTALREGCEVAFIPPVSGG